MRSEGQGFSPQGRKRLGAWGEKLAREYLQRQGWHIRDTNVRSPHGEIDIVAQHGEELVFVEVRTRKSRAFGLPEESITPAKKEKLTELAQAYIQENDDLPSSWRIDVVVVDIGPNGSPSRIELIQNAID